MNLYIDIGNTNIKISFKDKIFIIPTNKKYKLNQLYFKIPIELKEEKNLKNIFISNVVDELKNIFNELFKKYYNKDVFWIDQNTKTNISFLIDNKDKLGSDIISLSVFASSISKECIVVNLGTATTFTYVKNNNLKGVIICAGILNQYKSLISSASKIQDIELSYSKNTYGKNTKESISIGIINATCILINSFVKKINPNAKVIISGGNMHFLKGYLNFDFVEEATVKGVCLISKNL